MFFRTGICTRLQMLKAGNLKLKFTYCTTVWQLSKCSFLLVHYVQSTIQNFNYYISKLWSFNCCSQPDVWDKFFQGITCQHLVILCFYYFDLEGKQNISRKKWVRTYAYGVADISCVMTLNKEVNRLVWVSFLIRKSNPA